MTKKQIFIDIIDSLISDNDMFIYCGEDEEKYNDFMTYWTALKGKDDEVKPEFTEKGKMVLDCLIKNIETYPFGMNARQIGEEMLITSRMVSGAANKLANDGYIEKIGKDPIVYVLTEKGKNIKFN